VKEWSRASRVILEEPVELLLKLRIGGYLKVPLPQLLYVWVEHLGDIRTTELTEKSLFIDL
jgi:hypothetical protein